MKLLSASSMFILTGVIGMFLSFFMPVSVEGNDVINFQLLYQQLILMIFSGIIFISGVILLAVHLLKAPIVIEPQKTNVAEPNEVDVESKKEQQIRAKKEVNAESKITPANHQNRSGMTKLMIAAKNFDVDKVIERLEMGENPMLENSVDHGARAITYARKAQCSSMSTGDKKNCKIVMQLLKKAEDAA